MIIVYTIIGKWRQGGGILTLFLSELVLTGSSAAKAILLAVITRRIDISK